MFSRSRTLTLRRAIVLAVVLGLLLPTLLISGYTWFKRYHYDIRVQTHELLQQSIAILANGMQEPLWNINHESAVALLEAMMSRNEDIVRIEVRDSTLGVFVSGERPERRRGYTATAEKPVIYRDNTIGSVRIEVSSIRLRQVALRDLLSSMLGVLAQAALSLGLILLLLERRLVQPLQKIGAGAERLAARQLDVPFTWQRLDEIGLLSRRMEDTRISLRKLFEELDRKNSELEQDIDKRKRIEQELHEREARFRALVEQSPIAIIEWDKYYQVIEWNAAAERIFGYSRQQALGRHAGFLVPNSRRDVINSMLGKITVSRGDARNIARNRRADGSIIICQWSHTRISDENDVRGEHLLSMAEDITEKRRAEEALSLSEAKFAGAFHGNPDSVSIARMSDWLMLEVNQAYEQVTGFTRDESVGRTALDLYLWVDPEQRTRFFRQLEERNLVRNFEWTMRTKHGLLRKCISTATVFSVAGERYILAVVRDVTDQRLLEEQKAEADRALLRLAQGTRDMAGESFFELLVADLASALRTDCAFIGLRVPQAQGTIRTLAAHWRGQPLPDFEYTAASTPCRDTLNGTIHIFPSGLMGHFPHACWHAEQAWESYAGAPLRDMAGNTIGVLAVLHTASIGNPGLVKSLLQVFSERASAELERKRAEEELRSSEQRFSTFFQSSPVAMYVKHLRGQYVIRDINHAFSELFQLSRDELIGSDSARLGLYRDPTDRQRLVEHLNTHGSLDGHPEIWMRRADGTELLVQFSGHAFTVAGERLAILACTDVTDKRRIENEIRELNTNLEQRVAERTEELRRANKELAAALETLNLAQEELVRSEKLAALGELVAGIAHELNTPIGNSLMVASTLFDQTRVLSTSYAEHGLKRSDLERYLEDAHEAGDILMRNLQRAASLVTGFKQVAIDQTSSQRRKFSVAEVVSEIMLTLWSTLKKTGFICEQQVPQELEMDSYPGPLGQVLTNLVNNALLHGFDGRSTGTVTISATTNADGWIELEVADDGVGIPAAHLGRIFDPFFTTKLGAGGSGLGLNIAHNIVTGMLGGKMRVHSEPGVGSRFIITMPPTAPVRQAEDGSQAVPACAADI